MSGIDVLVDKVTSNLPSLEQVWVCGDLAKGLPSEYIKAVLVGVDLNRSYIKQLTDKAQSLMGKTISVKVEEEIDVNAFKDGLLVWQKQCKPLFVADSISPTIRTLSVTSDANAPGYRAFTFDSK